MKINRRLITIAIVSFAIALILFALMYYTMKEAAEPEPKTKIAYFKHDINKDSELNVSDIVLIDTPVSLAPQNAVRSLDEVRGKRLISKVVQGEAVLSGKLIERGDEMIDTKQLFTIGIDVTNISNFLGGNLKEGREYVLLYKGGNTIILSKIKIVSLIDATCKLITGNTDGVVKTINVSVESETEMLNIASVKGFGNFEIISAPESYEVKPAEIDIKALVASSSDNDN